MRQNRVDPFGNFIKTEARGTFWGNRGALHKDGQEILRPFRLEQWITCTLDYKGIRRKIMAPNRLTELFFLDEVTSFAAGHRPCALCRRPAFEAFKSAWLKGNPRSGFDINTSIKRIDHQLHAERIDKEGKKVFYFEKPRALPDGTMIVFEKFPWLIWQTSMYLWTPFGYEKGKVIPDMDPVQVLTPVSTVNAFRAGYIPGIAGLPTSTDHV